MVTSTVKRFTNSLADGDPDLPSKQVRKSVLAYDVRMRLKLAKPLPRDQEMSFLRVKEVVAKRKANSPAK
jgi:hypothetical protein